jgi:hypothetical protein
MPAPFDEALPGESRERPFWSVMIPVYNSTNYLAKTLESVLSQDPGPDIMQIEVVDGHSTVNLPESLVRQIAGDRVGVFRHPTPLSMSANWNSCIDRARGEWVHILHADDFVLPGFYSRLRESLSGRKDVAAAFTRWMTVDEADHIMSHAPAERETAGVLPDSLERIASAQIIQCASIVVQKSTYQEVGGYRSDLSFVLDWEMWVRLASRRPFWYEPEPLACYRVHTKSETSRLQRLGEDLRDQLKGIAIIQGHLTPGSKAQSSLALRVLEVARGQLLLRQPRRAMRSVLFAFRLSCAPRVIVSAVRLFGWACAGTAKLLLKRVGILTSGGCS